MVPLSDVFLQRGFIGSIIEQREDLMKLVMVYRLFSKVPKYYLTLVQQHSSGTALER